MENSKVPRLVFDVDDTICVNGRRNGYEYAEPKLDVIEKINHLHDDLGYEIVLHTARGMISCDGDLERIKEKNEAVLIAWLRKWQVHFDELVFGKPIADLYVDDKGISLSQFMHEDFGPLHGGSGQNIYRLGNIVRKDMKTFDEVLMIQDFEAANNGSIKTPKLISTTYNSVYMEYIDGKLLCDCLDERTLMDLIFTIYGFSIRKNFAFNIDNQIEILLKNKGYHDEIDDMIDKCIFGIKRYRRSIEDKASFCHGDMTLCNIIKDDISQDLYFIDPRFDSSSSSYLLDYAKLRMSLSGYEYEFGISKNNNKKYIGILDKFLESVNLLDEVIILELMYILRLTRYKEDKEKVAKFAGRLMVCHEELFRPV